MLSLVMLALSFLNASFSSESHLNLASLCVSCPNGAVSVEYLGMNYDRYPIIPKKLLTACLDSGGLASLTASTFSGLGFSPSLVNWCP